MSADDKIFAGSIPENYDRQMVPLIFESYARDIAARAAALSPKAVLETAAGSGVVTRALAPKLSDDVTNALAKFFPNDPPRFMVRTPHGYHDVALIRSDLAKAGFSNVTVETRTDESRAPSARHAATAYCQGTPLRNEIEARGPDK